MCTTTRQSDIWCYNAHAIIHHSLWLPSYSSNPLEELVTRLKPDKMSGRMMKYPYTFSAKVAQFPWGHYTKNVWLFKYYGFGVGLCIPVFMWIQKMCKLFCCIYMRSLIRYACICFHTCHCFSSFDSHSMKFSFLSWNSVVQEMFSFSKFSWECSQIWGKEKGWSWAPLVGESRFDGLVGHHHVHSCTLHEIKS